jgi:hypothetical protein
VAGGDIIELVDTLLLAAPGQRRMRLLVVVDQFEELLVQTRPEEQASFAALLRTLVGGPVSVVATLRPEFLESVLAHPDLSVWVATATHILRPMRREMLRTVIEGLAGITVSDGLVSLLVEDTGGGDALPLLAFALEQLAEGVGGGGRLSKARYDALGEEAVLAALLRVVTVDEQNRPTRWHVKRADLSEAESAELDAFVTRRFLTVDAVGRDVVIGASHEACFTAWPPLDTVIRDTAAALAFPPPS